MPGQLDGFKKQAAECIRITKEKDMTVYGDVSEPLLNLLKTQAVGHTWFSFLQGLEPSAVVPSRILAAAGEVKPV